MSMQQCRHKLKQSPVIIDKCYEISRKKRNFLLFLAKLVQKLCSPRSEFAVTLVPSSPGFAFTELLANSV